MGHVLKLIYLLLRGLVYDNKDEFDFKSTKFNSRKFIILIVLFLSMMLNIALFFRFWAVSGEYIHYREEAEKLYPNITSVIVKKPAEASSDRH